MSSQTLPSSRSKTLLQHKEIARWLQIEGLDDEHELLPSIERLSFSSLASEGEAVIAEDDPKPSKVAMGDSDVDNVFYVNFNPTLPARAKVSLENMQKSLNLNTNWLSAIAGVQTQKKIDSGQLPSSMDIDDQFRRNNYRSKVIDYYIHNSPW